VSEKKHSRGQKIATATRTISVIMLHPIVLPERTALARLKHHRLLLGRSRWRTPALDRATTPFPPARDTSGFVDNFGHGQVKVDHARHGAQRMRRTARVLCRGRVVAAMWETHGAGAGKPAEERREEGLHDGFGDHAPRKDDQDARRHLE